MAQRTDLAVHEQHRRLMALALDEAGRAAHEGEVPVGAVLVDASGAILARGHNACRPESGHADPTAHAEMVVLREAAAHTERGTLEGCTLVVTLEPCTMCAGAILAARIPTVVFGAWDEKAGAAGSVFDVLRDRRMPHRCEVIAGVEESACQSVLQEFFAQRR